MGIYRKKPIEIEAVQLSWRTWSEVCELLGEALVAENPGSFDIKAGAQGTRNQDDIADTCGEPGPDYITLFVRTINDQRVRVRHGDWIVPDGGMPGRFYPVDPAVFAKTYDVVEP